MRIALIAAHGPLALDTAGSQPAQPTSLARALAGHGHRVTLYTRRDTANCPRTAILGPGVSVEHVAAGPARPLSAEETAKYMPGFAAQLADRWRVRQPDVVHAFSWTSGLAAIGAARSTDLPVLQTFESLGSAERRQLKNSDVSACRVKLEASIGRTVAGVLAGSADEADELARLELTQETGLRARHLVKLGSLNCAHGISSQAGHVLLATGLEPGTAEREPEEQDMRQEWVSRPRFEEMVSQGLITDASTVAAYAMLLMRERTGN